MLRITVRGRVVGDRVSVSNGKYASFSTVCCRTVGKNRHRLRRNAAIHFHLLHTHQGSSAQLVVPARIGAPPSRCYGAAGRACCDAATRLNNPKASPSQALSRTAKHPPPPLIFETSPLPSETSLSPHPRDLLRAKTLPRAPRGPPREGEEGTKVEGGRGGGEGGFANFFTEDNCKAIC